MPSGNHDKAGERLVVYCLVPAELASKLYEPLRRHFRDDPGIEVIVERRSGDRRRPSDRRRKKTERAPATSRRRIRSLSGRRLGDRRAALVPIDRPALPRAARAHAERLQFVERLEPSTEQAEDRDTARLVTRFQAGERDVFADLYMRYFDRVYGYLRLVVRDQHEAEDLTQQSFVKVLESLDSYERRTQPFRAWLFVIVRNFGLMSLRRESRIDLAAPEEVERRREQAGGDQPPADALDWISNRELMLFVERLPALQRQVVALRLLLDLSAAQTAAILGTTPQAVRSLQYRAMQTLRERLGALRAEARPGRRPWMRAGVRQATVLRRRRFALLAR